MFVGDGLDLEEDVQEGLMGTKELAEHFGLSREYVTDHLTKRPDFPAPFIRLSRKTVKWRRADIEKFRCKHC